MFLPEFALLGVAAVFSFNALPNVGFFKGTNGFDITALSISSVFTIKIKKRVKLTKSSFSK